MCDEMKKDETLLDPIQNWRQGDFTLDGGGFFFGNSSDQGEPFDVILQTEGVVGLIVISQTCEIVQLSGGRHYVAVCPLIEVDEKEIVSTEKGMRPYLAFVENTDKNVFADLRRLMSIHKNLLAQWKRTAGFTTASKQMRFAAALERKFGQFAFPDDFNAAIERFRRRIWRRHDKTDSPIGVVYRSISEIRFRALPSWEADEREITVLAILDSKSPLEVSEQRIYDEVNAALDTVDWPTGYVWSDTKFQIASTDQLTVADYLTSVRGDFDYLSY